MPSIDVKSKWTVAPRRFPPRDRSVASEAVLGLLGTPVAHHGGQFVVVTKDLSVLFFCGSCYMIDKELAKEKGESVALCDCCADIQQDLDAAATEMTKLRKALKIELPEMTKKERHK